VALVTGITAGCMAYALNFVTELLSAIKFRAAEAYVAPGGADD